ncbi:MAG TPA: hypothetical protein VKV32_04175 [Stellaceae bacterium]|nr:hypothetical protein [Stellaceae bacterium]
MSRKPTADFSHISRAWPKLGEEPVLADLLADPVLHRVMRRDGVSMIELCNHIATARSRLGLKRFGGGPCRCAA